MSCTSASFEFLDKTRGLKVAFTFFTMSFFSLARPVREHMTLLVHSWLEA